MKRFIYFIGLFLFPFLIQANQNSLYDDCNIGTIVTDITGCEEGLFAVYLNFDYENVGNEGFSVTGNGTDYGDFEYADLPVLIGPLEGDGETVYEFLVTDNQFEECSNWTEIEPVDCGGAECLIWDLVVVDHPCVDELFDVYLYFDYTDVSDEGFEVFVNDVLFGAYTYDQLPLNIGSFSGDGETIYHFLVQDIVSENCAEDLNFGPISCDGECGIGEIVTDITDCEEGFFAVYLNFPYESIGAEGFSVTGNGTDYGDFEYADLPVLIGPLEGDGETVYEFLVTDNQFEECSNWTEIEPVDCGGAECLIWDLVVVDHPCVDELFDVYLYFNYTSVSDEGFEVFVNDDLFGAYTYDQLPLNIGPFSGDGETIYHFLVQDIVSENCAEDLNFGPISCDGECGIGEIVTDITECEDGFFAVYLNFPFESIGAEGFSVISNGSDYGDFEYANLPVLIGPLEGDGETVYEFVVTDNQFEECSSWTEIDPVYCEGGECNIDDLNVIILPCNEYDDFNILLDFQYNHIGNEGFHVQGGEIHYGDFDYSDLPIEIGPFGAEIEYEILVFDNQTEGCSDWTEFGPINCDTIPMISDLNIEIVNCNNNTYYIDLNFNRLNTGNSGFTVSGNGMGLESFSYESLPVNIGPLYNDEVTSYYFIVEDAELKGYGNWKRFSAFNCGNLSINEDETNEVRLFPNPSQGTIIIQQKYAESSQLEIYDLLGNLYYTVSLNGEIMKKVNLPNINNGMYLYKIIYPDGKIKTGRLLINRN